MSVNHHQNSQVSSFQDHIFIGTSYLCGFSFSSGDFFSIVMNHATCSWWNLSTSGCILTWAHLDIIQSFYEGAGRKTSPCPGPLTLCSHIQPLWIISGDYLRFSARLKAAPVTVRWYSIWCLSNYHNISRGEKQADQRFKYESPSEESKLKRTKQPFTAAKFAQFAGRCLIFLFLISKKVLRAAHFFS